MARCGDVYENHVTGERAVVLRGDEDGGGESVIVAGLSPPGSSGL